MMCGVCVMKNWIRGIHMQQGVNMNNKQVLFDIIPLRVVPPLMMGLISYYMVGLVDGVAEFFKFLLVLVLFNLTAAALCLAIGVVFKNLSMANLLCCMVILFSMLFAGLLLNKGKMSRGTFRDSLL